MDLDEIIYTRFVRYFARQKNQKDKPRASVVYLSDIHARLLLLSRAFTGQAVEIFHGDSEGGCKGLSFFLPGKVDLFSDLNDNERFYLYRIVYLSLQLIKQHYWLTASDLLASREKSLSMSTIILNEMQALYPRVYEIYQDLHSKFQSVQNVQDDIFFYGKWMTVTPEKQTSALASDNRFVPSSPDEIKTVMKAKAIEEIQSLQIDIKAQQDYVLTHNFEKVETAEEFNGTWRDFDGEDELSDQYDAVEELNMKWTVRSDDTVHSVYQADFIENTVAPETSDAETRGVAISYPEWNYKSKSYRSDYVKVYPVFISGMQASFYHQTMLKYHLVLKHLRKMMAAYHNKLISINRQKDGPELDIDALTDMTTDILSRKSPSDRVYLNRRKKQKDLGITLLIDSSLSSDGYTDGNRIIDVAKEVSLLFGEILDEYQVEFSIAAFHSHTRNNIEYIYLKSFSDAWSQAKLKVGALQPAGFTRIGGAIRHAAADFVNTSAKNKWLILLSDGKPNDFDTYEGKYGIQDVKQSLHELNAQKINAFAFAIEAQARYYLPQMFGQNHYQILSSPEQLIQSLFRLYEKIRHGQ